MEVKLSKGGTFHYFLKEHPTPSLVGDTRPLFGEHFRTALRDHSISREGHTVTFGGTRYCSLWGGHMSVETPLRRAGAQDLAYLREEAVSSGRQ